MKTRALALLAMFLLGHASASLGQQDELEPPLGYFSDVDPPTPYEAALRRALVGEHRYRKCQVVVLPSFEREWAVYIVREDDAAGQVLFRRFKKPLWDEMLNVISEAGRKDSIPLDDETQQAALARVEIELERSAATLGDRAADLLEDVWWRMLGRARYPDDPDSDVTVVRADGTIYHMAHWRRGLGVRSGATWSPEHSREPGPWSRWPSTWQSTPRRPRRCGKRHWSRRRAH